MVDVVIFMMVLPYIWRMKSKSLYPLYLNATIQYAKLTMLVAIIQITITTGKCIGIWK